MHPNAFLRNCNHLLPAYGIQIGSPRSETTFIIPRPFQDHFYHSRTTSLILRPSNILELLDNPQVKTSTKSDLRDTLSSLDHVSYSRTTSLIPGPHYYPRTIAQICPPQQSTSQTLNRIRFERNPTRTTFLTPGPLNNLALLDNSKVKTSTWNCECSGRCDMGAFLV